VTDTGSEERLRTLLALAAEADARVHAPGPELTLRARCRLRRRRQLAITTATLATVAAVTVPTALIVNGGGSRSLPRPTPAAPPTYPTTGPGSINALRHDAWRELPDAPIMPRSDPATVWTGKEFIVWGGDTPGRVSRFFGDGAAYDPATNSWRKLPPSPLTPRAFVAAVWTGNELFIYGGDDTEAGLYAHRASDGALYDPATRTWRTLPPSPLGALSGATAMWTGHDVVVLGGQGPRFRMSLEAVAFNPATDAWRRLPSLPTPAAPVHYESTIFGVDAVAAGDTVYAWVLGQDTRTTHGSNGTTILGRPYIEFLRLDRGASSWARVKDQLPSSTGVQTPLWTGRELLLPASQNYCGNASCPATLEAPGHRYDPAAGAWRPMSLAPRPDVGWAAVWTGSALLRVDGGVETGGPHGRTGPGDLLAWDPSTDRWLRLPSARFGGETAVWCGDRLIVWGLLYKPTRTGATQVPATGLSFGPPGH